VAGILHDIGKIHVPSEILTRPSRLSDIEFAMIKTHPEIGYEIMKTIENPWSVADMILQHHEKLNGSGYPGGLKDNAILLEAKILCVADVVEAMASHRPYRASLGIEKALEEIVKNKGLFYEPIVVDACIKLFKEEKFRFEY
jgi:HD-GYP domain-containing protein (c-di-GMP phosphodiesterase class II)